MADTDYLAASDGSGDAALMHVTSPRTALATIIQVDTVVGVPAFFIGTWGTLLSNGFIDPTTKRDFFGHVNAGTLVIDKMAPGNTDGGNTTGQVVVIKPNTAAQNLMGNFVKSALNLFGQGEILNGKIVTSVATNNLTVAIKTLAGVDPSTTDVVYVRIGNTVRTITAPLTKTLNAGTNWFGKGASYWASKDTDFFAYLCWNTTDSAVSLGFSSIPDALKYSDFSTTNTNYNYWAATGSAPAATDVVENIGRFNATLGPTASFNWSIAATSIIINRPMLETRIYSATATGTGAGNIYWQQRGSEKKVWGLTAPITLTAATNTNFGIDYPTGFFSAAPHFTLGSPTGGTDSASISWGVSGNTTTSAAGMAFYFYVTSGGATTGSTPVSYMSIGT